MVLPQNTIAISEIAFYERHNNQLKQISNVKVSANIKKEYIKELHKIVDGLSGTGFLGSFDCKDKKNRNILFDLGKETEVYAISIIPKSGIQVNNNENFTLYYWDNEWIPEKVVKGDKECITFDSIPSDALYLIKSAKPMDSYYAERIFTHKKGRIYWW